ncbi:MAG: shikimate dehydrogenase [Thermoplasmata archaeon]|jgi:shikimate dehydrogenase/3-dehydroquinate dehydratase type I|nr:shikimate dehydrogenase [Thermoplasmata archaeon]
MTLLVATAIGETPDELYARARAAEAHADWIEIRLDGPSGLPWDLRAFFSFAKPCIATMRHADDGGRSHADDKTRNDILRRALRAGAKAIDVELANDEARALVAEAHAMDAQAIVSQHDLAGTPSADALLATLRQMRALGADVAKIATFVQGPQDAAALVEAAQRARQEKIPCAIMAVNDPFLRLLAPALGLALAYGSVPGAPAATAGQVPLDALRRVQLDLSRSSFGAATRAAYVVGHPVSHSLSPAMHNAAFRALGLDACYLALDVAPQNLDAAIAGFRAAPPLGVSLTVPHKVAALDLVDVVSPEARAAGAANALVFRDGKVEAHNTDGAGALDALAEAGVAVRGLGALVLGAGGAARGVAHALAGAGARVTVSNRTAEKAAALGFAVLPWGADPAPFALVVNCTTVGLHQDESPIDVARLGSGAALLDAVYRPGGTRLVREARARGLVAVDGRAMLLHQGARAFKLWTGREAPLDAMRSVLS